MPFSTIRAAVALLLLCCISRCESFATISRQQYRSNVSTRAVTTDTDATATTIANSDILDQIEAKIAQIGPRGDGARPLIEQLESRWQESKDIYIEEPNRSKAFLGPWNVHWTDCPPPSNGQLGPFGGTSSQIIASDGTYRNFLKTPPSNWLTATLDGVWEDWDGQELPDKPTDVVETKYVNNDNTDWGTNHWMVTFKTLNIKVDLFGLKLTLVDKVFPPNVSRVWRTTYLDDKAGIRIVRAGRSGKAMDERVFYTKRAPLN